MDKKTYKKYKRRIAQAVAKVDNKPPRFEVSAYYKPHNMRSDINRIREIDKQNIKLLRRMNIITRLRVRIKSFISVINIFSSSLFSTFLYTYTTIFYYWYVLYLILSNHFLLCLYLVL